MANILHNKLLLQKMEKEASEGGKYQTNTHASEYVHNILMNPDTLAKQCTFL